jgi:hypothetical protein
MTFELGLAKIKNTTGMVMVELAETSKLPFNAGVLTPPQSTIVIWDEYKLSVLAWSYSQYVEPFSPS